MRNDQRAGDRPAIGQRPDLGPGVGGDVGVDGHQLFRRPQIDFDDLRPAARYLPMQRGERRGNQPLFDMQATGRVGGRSAGGDLCPGKDKLVGHARDHRHRAAQGLRSGRTVTKRTCPQHLSGRIAEKSDRLSEAAIRHLPMAIAAPATSHSRPAASRSSARPRTRHRPVKPGLQFYGPAQAIHSAATSSGSVLPTSLLCDWHTAGRVRLCGWPRPRSPLRHARSAPFRWRQPRPWRRRRLRPFP